LLSEGFRADLPTNNKRSNRDSIQVWSLLLYFKIQMLLL
jgi:hypothetical protein